MNRTRARWAWLLLFLLPVACVVMYWMAYAGWQVRLSDGSVVTIVGIEHGRRISPSDFERHLFVFRPGAFVPWRDRIPAKVQRVFGGGAREFGVVADAPDWIMLEASPTNAGHGATDTSAWLEDGTGFERQIVIDIFDQERSGMHTFLPRRGETLTVRFRDRNRDELGAISFPNPVWCPQPLFEGRAPPLSCTVTGGTARLMRADYQAPKEGNESPWGWVKFEFDLSNCEALLPCHLIGVRVTDAYGNSSLAHGQVEDNGTRITAHLLHDHPDNHAWLQSPDCRVQLAICRGYGAAFRPGETAAFERIAALEWQTPNITKKIGLHDLTLTTVAVQQSKHKSDIWRDWNMTFEVEGASQILWPVIVKASHVSPDGGLQVADLREYPLLNHHIAPMWLEPVRAASPDYREGPLRPKSTPTFQSHLALPQEFRDVTFEVALEPETVFEFVTRIGGWPSGTQGEPR